MKNKILAALLSLIAAGSAWADDAPIEGRWLMSDPCEGYSYRSDYRLELAEGGTASLSMPINIDGESSYNEDNPFYLADAHLSTTGTWQKTAAGLTLSFDQAIESSIDKVYFQDSQSVRAAINALLSTKKEEMTDFIKTRLGSVKISELNEYSLSIAKGSTKSAFARQGVASGEMEEADKALRADEYFEYDSTRRIVTRFKRHYNDGTVTFDAEKGTVIEFANGDRFEGKCRLGCIHPGGVITTPDKNSFDEALQVARRIHERPMISDQMFEIKEGTYHYANGSDEQWVKGASSYLLNIAVEAHNSKVMDKLKILRSTCAAAKKKLIAEGFRQSQVTALIDNCTVEYGMPRELFLRAKQLGANVTLSNPFVVDNRYRAYIVSFIDLKTGDTILDSIVRFHWLSDKVIYIGSDF